ncbi:MAG: hypothetical protein K2Y20_14795 [Sphingomonas sp.]|nr:hypothetical protein [Sphingomonas sp.]
MGTDQQHRADRGDVLLAFAFALLLGLAWAARDWGNLSALHLPDTDDAMRLQQIRDWLSGQAFADVRQHRLAGGLAMHWSRLPDLVPAAIITLLRPLIGLHAAEVAAVVAWPLALFGAALALVAVITRKLAPEAARTAIIVAGVAYPVTTLFAPGRIDHHGLQIVFVLVAVRALLAAPGWVSGIVAGVATGASLIVGMEMAPVLSLVSLSVWVGWWLGRGGANGQLAGLGAGLSGSIALGATIFATTDWGYTACDSFTSTVWMAAQIGAVAPLVLGLATPLLGTKSLRAAASLMIGGIVALPLLPIAHACANPYGAVDPLVARLWLDHVGEAQSLFVAPFAAAVAYAGLLVAGIAATLWQLRRGPERGWAMLLALQLAALAVACFELRGVYAGVILGTPALAVAIGEARARGALWLAGAWLGSAGMLYPIAAQAFAPTGTPSAACNPQAALAALPTGTVMAPIDVGAYAIAAGPHRMIAAPYHRNNVGNAAMYRFFLGTPGAAQAIAARWRVDYVLLCPGDFGEVDRATTRDPHRLLSHLRADNAPGWLSPIATASGAKLWRVAPRLREAPRAD